MCVQRCACEGQRTTCRSRFSLSATWVPGIELSSVAGAFCLLSHVAISTWLLSASPRLCSRLTAAADAKGAEERNRPLVRVRLALSLNVRFPAGLRRHQSAARGVRPVVLREEAPPLRACAAGWPRGVTGAPPRPRPLTGPPRLRRGYRLSMSSVLGLGNLAGAGLPWDVRNNTPYWPWDPGQPWKRRCSAHGSG